MKTLDEQFPSYPTMEDIIALGSPEGQFFADTKPGYFTTLDFFFEFDLENNLARIVTINVERDGRYSVRALESRPLKNDGDYAYWIKDQRLVLPRDLPEEMHPLVTELMNRYNTERLGEK